MYQYFHLCTHQSSNVNFREDEVTVVIQNKSEIDLLIRGATVLDVYEVRVIRYKPRSINIQLEYDKTNENPDFIYDNEKEGYSYYDDALSYYQNYEQFFEPGSNISNPIPRGFYEVGFKNRMKWLVEPPIEYQVKMKIRYDREYVKEFALEDCEICQGNGWFVDIIDNTGLFGIDTGVMKIVQRLIKDILTELFSSVLDLEYGTKIKQIIMQNAKDDEELFDDVRLVINGVETKYLQRQALEYNTLEPNERLEMVSVENIFRLPSDQRKIILELRIVTEEEDTTFALRL